MSALVLLAAAPSAGCQNVIVDPPFEQEFDENAPFAKPENYQLWSNPFGDVGTSSGSGGTAVSFIGRDHMRPSHMNRAYWLEPGEPLVVDVRYEFDMSVPSREFDMVVLVDFEPVAFGWHEVEHPDDVLTVEEAAALEDLAPAHRFVLEARRRHGFTLVIPAGAFPEAKAYDVRLVPLRRDEPGAVPQNQAARDAVLSGSFVVYNGGTKFGPSSAPPLRGLDYVGLDRKRWDLMPRSGALLLPPREVHDLDAHDPTTNQAALGGELAVAGGAVTLEVLLAGLDSITESGPAFVVAFSGTTMLDEPYGIADLRALPNEILRAIDDGRTDGRVARLTFDVPLTTDAPEAVRVVKLPHPFVRWGHDIAELQHLGHAHSSNVLHLSAAGR